MIYEGNCRLGDLFSSRREKGRAGLPTLSVTMNDGLINREDLDRKQETNLTAEEHLLVKPGDLAYNMMRMWQGAFGLADREGLVSPAYVVLKPKSKVNPHYASYLFGTPRMIHLFWAYSYGLTEDRLRLYYPDFARIPVTIPPKSSQEKIARLLATWDRAIAVAEQLDEVNEKWRRSVYREMTLGLRRLPEQKQPWKTVRLGDVAKIVVSSVDKKHAQDELPVVLCNYIHVYYNRYLWRSLNYDVGTASASEIARFQLKKGDIVITKDSEQADDIGIAACVVEDMPNVICGYHLAIVRPDKRLVDSTFLGSIFSNHHIRRHFAIHANGVTRFGLPISSIEALAIQLPSLAEQRELAAVIRELDDLCSASRRQLTYLRQEKGALTQKLFRGSAATEETLQATGGGP